MVNDFSYEGPPRGVRTNGIGSTGNTAHLYLKPKPAVMGRPKGPRELTKFPYAGKDKFAHGEEWSK